MAVHSDIVAVVTQPDRPSGRGHRLTPTPIKVVARDLGLPVVEPVHLKTFAGELRERGADFLVVASYGRILPQAILDCPLRGIAFNVHPSLLPLYRGATPLQTAIRDGRTQTGVTIIAMDAGMDTGDILVQERTLLGARETYGELHERLARRAAELLVQAIAQLAGGRLERRPQALAGVTPQEIEATLTRPLSKDDMVVDWSLPAARVVDAIRSLAPAPAARAVFEGETVKIHAARQADAAETGVTTDDGFVQTAGDGAGVVVLRLTPPNRGVMSGAAYVHAREAV